MSAVAGLAAKALPIASKVIGALPVVGGIAKKIVGGIKGIFGSKPSSQDSSQSQGGMQGMMSAGRDFAKGARGMLDAGRSVYQGFKSGGFGGGMAAIQQQMPSMQQSFGGMVDAAQRGYSTGRGMYEQARTLGQGTMQDIRRMRRGFQGGGFGGMGAFG